MSECEHLDAVVIGANIRGLVTCHVLDSLGYRAVLIDRSPKLGGADGSFTTAWGDVFDFGMHVLDFERSPLATRLFTAVSKGAVRKTRLRRGIALRGHLMPYAPLRSEMPDELRALLPSDDLADELGDDAPTRANLARHYGRDFVDLIFDEVLPSFPSEARHLTFGVDESELMANIYPWFFPRAARKQNVGDESRQFHDRLRAGVDQHVLYPSEGGFGAFARAFADSFDPERIELLLGAGDVRFELDGHRARWVQAGGRRFSADHFFWAAAWPGLCQVLDLPCQNVATDRIALGSLRLDRPAHTDYHEILVGDPECAINRVYFPAAFRHDDAPLLQIEFAYPAADERPSDPGIWRDRWTRDLRRLGLIDDHRVEQLDFKCVPIHFNSYGMEGERLIDADPNLLEANSNVRPVVPSMANLNLNRHVPRTVAYVASVLAQ